MVIISLILSINQMGLWKCLLGIFGYSTDLCLGSPCLKHINMVLSGRDPKTPCSCSPAEGLVVLLGREDCTQPELMPFVVDLVLEEALTMGSLLKSSWVILSAFLACR